MATLTKPPRQVPMWLMALGSLFAGGHLLAIGLLALSASSGPWPTPFPGVPSSPSPGPAFATTVTAGLSFPYYLQPLRMTHNYHFESNKPVMLGIYFEVKLKDEHGDVFKTLKFPDDKANFWVRHRQSILAQGLGNDQPVAPRGTNPIAGKGKELPTVEVWDRVDKDTMRLAKIEILDLKRDRQYERPSDGAKVLAEAYMRYLCREYKAASAELIRHHRPAILPMVLVMPNPPTADDFLEFKSHFGEYRRED